MVRWLLYRVVIPRPTVIGEFSIITIHQAGACEAALLWGKKNLLKSVGEPRVARRDEKDERCNQDGRVKHGVVLVALNKALPLNIIACSQSVQEIQDRYHNSAPFSMISS